MTRRTVSPEFRSALEFNLVIALAWEAYSFARKGGFLDHAVALSIVVPIGSLLAYFLTKRLGMPTLVHRLPADTHSKEGSRWAHLGSLFITVTLATLAAVSVGYMFRDIKR